MVGDRSGFRESYTLSTSPIEILFQDDDIVVVNKPSGILVHRGWDNDKVVAMTMTRDQLGKYVYPVHRLDRPTSGALLFALNKDCARRLCDDFSEGRIKKHYVALVRGITPAEGVIDNPVPKSPKGKRVNALTAYKRLYAFERYSLVSAFPRTGRLHQIRRHLKHINHPLIGDVTYGKGEHNRAFRERFGLHRLALHAVSLSFAHPNHGRKLMVKAGFPDDLVKPFCEMGIPPEIYSDDDSIPIRCVR